jgi:hypothetical protein
MARVAIRKGGCFDVYRPYEQVARDVDELGYGRRAVREVFGCVEHVPARIYPTRYLRKAFGFLGICSKSTRDSVKSVTRGF